jgi:hypothetical protein
VERFKEITDEVVKQLYEQTDMPVEGSFDYVVQQENIKAREARAAVEVKEATPPVEVKISTAAEVAMTEQKVV